MPDQTSAKTTTDVVGYYNPNNYRIKLSSSILGLNISLNPGAFVVNQAGHRVNDPRLEVHVGAGRLSRSKSTTGQVDIVLVGAAPDERSAAGFTATNETRAPKQAALPPVPQTDPTPVRPTSTNARVTSRSAVIGPGAETVSSSTSFRAMSVGKALELGLIKPSIIPSDADLPSATTGYTRTNAEKAPRIDEVMPRDARGPREAAAALASVGKGEKSAAQKAVQRAQERPPTAPHAPAAALAVAGTIPDADVGEHESIDDDIPVVDIGAESARLLTEAGATVAAAATAPAADAFTCAADRLSFPTFKALQKHVRRNFPDRAEELLSGYKEAAN